MVKVVLKNVSKKFGKVVAVDKVSLEVKDGELFTILGPSGCGKTTTLRIVAGFEFPDEGMVLFDDVDVTYWKPYKRGTAMVFQNYALWPHMSVFDNVAYGLRVRKLPRDEVRRRVMEVLELVGLKGLEDRYPLQLSGGQQQRVALARALVIEPKVLLLDEPLSNLDAKLRVKMREEIKRLQKRLGITTIYVTHDQEEAMSLSDRIAIMNNGRVAQIGRPKEVYMNPSNLFVATFIGRSTALIGKVVDVSSGRVKLAISEDVVIKGKVAKGYELSVNDEAIAIMRPEDFDLEKPEAEANELTGVVDLTMFIGAFTQVKLRIGNQSFKAYLDPDIEVRPGAKMTVYIKVDDVIVFPKKEWEEVEFEAIA
ncbi:MAG: ABC transporter ATP-binding protein [Desulfurococcales archaeon]|nr:ABC transporter ATP-binding protein [Desulfurococcales archaeon]